MVHGPEGDISDRLAAAHEGLPPQAARVAAYVGEHTLESAFLSARELAAAAGVSVATVVRFPRLLGYENLGDLREAIQDRISFELTSVERVRSLPAAHVSPSAALKRAVEADVESLHGLTRTFSEPEFDRFVDALAHAARITVLATQFAAPLGEHFAYSLGKIRPAVEATVHADSIAYYRVSVMEADDLLVVIGFARYPADTVQLVRFAQRQGVRVVAVTDTPLSPYVPLAETALLVRVSTAEFVGSLAAPGALLNTAVAELRRRLGDAALERLERQEDVARRGGMFVAATTRRP
jgi:DNA-binding MurR/RpiR family transcriptional regulator